MSSSLVTFSDLPGVIGTCVITKDRLHGTTLPGFSGQDGAHQAFAPIHQAFEEAQDMGIPLSHTTMTYGDTRVLFSTLEDLLIAVFHQEDTDVGALIERFESHRRQLQSELDEMVHSPPIQNHLPPPPTYAQPPKKEHVIFGTVRDDLQRILKVLTTHIGPAAAVLMDEALTHWLDKGPASRDRLNYLVEQLAVELPTRQSVAEFRFQAQAAIHP